MTDAPKSSNRQIFTAVFLIGFLCLMVELIQVRMLSFFLGSISNFLAIPIALFGLALGSIFCHFIYRGDRKKLVALCSSLLLPVLAATFIAFFLIANGMFSKIHFAIATPAKSAERLFVYSALFLPSYGLFGVLLTTYFSEGSSRIGRLYFWDLLGAALGCLATSLLFTYTDLPAVIVAILFVALVITINSQARHKVTIVVLSVILFGTIQAMTFGGHLFKEHPDEAIISRILIPPKLRKTGVAQAASRWNHLTRTALYHSHANSRKSQVAKYVIVQDDAVSNVSVEPYMPDRPGEYYLKRRLHQSLPHLMGMDPKEILVIFAGAGKDMIQLDAIHEGRARITGVEINPEVKAMAMHPAVFKMGVAHFLDKPNINYVVREGRDFLNNDTNKYDLIFTATNGAVHASRTGHTRKYLDTYEAMEAYLDHLAPGGTIMFVNQPIERKVESLRAILEKRGMPPLAQALYAFGPRGSATLQSAVIKPSGLTKTEVDAMVDHVKARTPRWTTFYSPFAKAKSQVASIVASSHQDRGAQLITDDRPFMERVNLDEFSLFPKKHQLNQRKYASNWIRVFTVLAFALVSLLVILAAGFAGKKANRLPFLWTAYFFVSGVSYMGVEIGLMAKAELFMGNPLYAVAIILASFLTSNGIGAFLQDKYRVMRGPLSIILYTTIAVAWGLLCVVILNRYLLSIPMVLKVVLMFVAVMPAGISLGMFYPFGVQTLVASGKESTVPVTYAAATLSSVLGSALAMTLIINWGFSTVIIAGAAGYILVAGIWTVANRFS